MTTTDAPSTGGGQGPAVPRRKRARQAPAARVLVTGAALTATGLLIAAMGAAGQAEQVLVTSAPPIAPATAPGTVPPPPAAPPVTIIVIHRRAAGTAPASAPSTARPTAPTAQAAPTAGRATPAPKPATTPAPVAKSSGS